MRICADLRVPVVPRGAGTGLSGGANAVDGCLVLDLSRMTAVKQVDADDLVAVVEPGIVNDDLKAILREQGLWYPPDPASAPWSTIGGNVATNAGGLCCVKYGVTRDYVLGMRAVMGGPAGYGNAVRLGRRTAKGVAGYDLTALMVGSEGTLGVVTEVTLRLRPAPRGVPRTIVGAFTSLVDAGRAVAEVTRRGLTPSALELLDHDTASSPSRSGSTSGSRPTPRRCCWPGSTPPGRPARPRRRASSTRSRPPTRPSRSSPPTTRRPRPCSPRGGWPTRRSSGSGRCSPRTSACHARRCRRCSPPSARSGPGTA